MDWTGGKRISKMRGGQQEQQKQQEHFAKRKTAGPVPEQVITYNVCMSRVCHDHEAAAGMEEAEHMDVDCTSMPIGRAAAAAAASCEGQGIDRHVLESSEWTLGLDEDFLPPLQLDKYGSPETWPDRQPVAAAAAKQVDPDQMETCGDTDIADHTEVREAVQDETQSIRSLKDNVSCSSHLESTDRSFHLAQPVLQSSKRTREQSDELVEDPFNLAHLISKKRPRQNRNWQGQFSSLQSDYHSMDI